MTRAEAGGWRRRRALLSLMCLAGCSASRWDTLTYDRFPLNWRRAERGRALIKVIALVPGGGDLAEAIGIELSKRGFVVIPPASTITMASGVDLAAIAQRVVPAKRNPGEMWKLRHALHAQGVDAFLIVRVHDFVPKAYLGRDFWQQADLEVYSTTEENAAFNGAIAGTGFINFRKDRPSTPSEAAAAMVMNLAIGPGGI